MKEKKLLSVIKTNVNFKNALEGLVNEFYNQNLSVTEIIYSDLSKDGTIKDLFIVDRKSANKYFSESIIDIVKRLFKR